MKQKETWIVSGLMIFLLVLWLGFFVHRDTRFAGSLVGGIFAVIGSLFLLIPFIYSVIKRVPFLKKRVLKHTSFATLLSIHIYAAIIGGILVLIHTGHKFQGVLATTLTSLLLVEIASGYVGRYLFRQISIEMNENKRLVSSLEVLYVKKIAELSLRPDEKSLISSFTGTFTRFAAPVLLRQSVPAPAIQDAKEVLGLAESIADVEYSIKTHELFKKLFSGWLKLHIVLSFSFYALLFLHAGGEIYLGLRWFR